jgi:subtilisin-like proprotein convertase family protein
VVPAGPGCPATTTSFSSTTPQAIDAGAPNTVTSTITVSGVDPHLWDLDVTTFITHGRNGDLQITLMSPAGTIVTLTSNNGGGNDNIFDGTLWDDQANPGGPAPYSDNHGMVTDTSYTDGVLASPLTPEEPLGAFIGEDPNGVWTLTIADTVFGDGGFLDKWQLDVSSLPATPDNTVSTFTNSTPAPILDFTAPTSDIVVSGLQNRVCNVRVLTHITHTFYSDLVIGLRSPSGTVVTLSSNNGDGGKLDVFNGTQWDDDANPAGQVPYMTNDGMVTDHAYVNMVVATPLTPEEPFAGFIGDEPNGTWTLTVGDIAGGDVGSLNDWTLEITTCTFPDTDGDGVGDPCDVCASGDDKVDSDGDGVPDACDPCGVCGVGMTGIMPLMVLGMAVMRARCVGDDCNSIRWKTQSAFLGKPAGVRRRASSCWA